MTRYIQRLRDLGMRCRHALCTPLWLLLVLAGATSCGISSLAEAQQVSFSLNNQQQFSQSPVPFMHNPYYGQESLRSRTTSYFDHDKPWYASDNVFVRYDGKRWAGSLASVLNCQGSINCYDGHDGYDLNLWFEPVLSSAGGRVIRAGWYNPLNHNAAFGLWVAIDHGNGFVTAYGHLSALTVSQNEHVGAQWQIGTSGTTGSSTGPHLHFGTYYYPSWRATDPSGWRGAYSNPNIVPDHRLWASGTDTKPVPLLSSKGKKIYPGALLVDDGGPGWSSTGHWHSAKLVSDIGGKLRWTATTSKSATATATWMPLLPASGYYEVGVFVDDNHASSGWVSYTIYSADPAHPRTQVKHRVELDESHIGLFQSSFSEVNTRAQWISLGVYYFASGQSGRVVLGNGTGEDGLQIAADGVEFAPLLPAVLIPPPHPTSTPTPVPTSTPQP